MKVFGMNSFKVQNGDSLLGVVRKQAKIIAELTATVERLSGMLGSSYCAACQRRVFSQIFKGKKSVKGVQGDGLEKPC